MIVPHPDMTKAEYARLVVLATALPAIVAKTDLGLAQILAWADHAIKTAPKERS